MGAIDSAFLFDFESEMQAVTEREYERLVKSLWFQKVTKLRPSSSKKEVIAWLLSTAMIKPQGKGGNIAFDDLVSQTTTYENLRAGGGFKISVDQLKDSDGKGLEFATQWSSDIGAYMGYWPQKQIAIAILNGETGKSYDGQAFFAGWDGSGHKGLHPYNPYDLSLGGYANMLTGSADGVYPGACPIDDSVTVDVAIKNLSKAFAYIASIKMPNGEDPRMLRPRGLLVPPRMTPRAQQLTNAKFIAQGATGGAGTGDISAIISNWGIDAPTECAEFGASQTYKVDEISGATCSGSDSDCYLAVEQISSSQLGALTYVDREPFRVTYYTGAGGGDGVDAILDRADELEWHCKGRNVAGYGHPYLLFKLKSA